MPDVRNNCAGYQAIAQLADATRKLMFDTLEVDFSRCSFFAANMAAPLGAALLAVEGDFNEVKVRNIQPGVEKILRKNGFLAQYGYPPLEDDNCTTLPYAHIQLKDGSRFDGYLKNHVQDKGIPSMTEGFGAAFKRKLYEIFENAAIHSNSPIGLCVCGQYFPSQERLDITISDAGIGIRENVRRHLNRPKMSSVAAIEWAIQEGHSTKRGSQPGGLGLKFLHDFISQNKGRIHIVSRFGFYEFEKGSYHCKKMAFDLPGVTVNVEINTGDISSYHLEGEILPEDIF